MFGSRQSESSVPPKVDPVNKVPKHAFLDISVDQRKIGRVNLTLFPNTPITSANFGNMCVGMNFQPPIQSQGLQIKEAKYTGSRLHRIIQGFMIQGGDVLFGRGSGFPRDRSGNEVRGQPGTGAPWRFSDENFYNSHRVGRLAMANSGPNSNGSQWYIATSPCTHLNGKHVVFGEVADAKSMQVVKQIEACGSSSGQPRSTVEIVNSGVSEYYTPSEVEKSRGKRF